MLEQSCRSRGEPSEDVRAWLFVRETPGQTAAALGTVYRSVTIPVG
jgi:hypothetical protein